MATTNVEQLVLQMSADMTRLNRNVVAGQQAFNRQMLALERRAQAMDRQLSRTMSQAGQNMTNALKSSLSGLAPTLAAAFSAQQVIKYADAYTGLQNSLKATGLEGQKLKQVEDFLYESANRNGVSVGATTELYQRAALARENLGASESQLQAMVSGTTAALKLQGISTTQASGALLQLGQLLGGSKVQVTEYNSLVDALPTLLQAVANGSDRWAGSVTKLNNDVRASKVGTQEFFQAALKGFGDMETRAAAATLTVGSALQILDNQLGRFVGQTDSSLSATNRMALAIQGLAMNLDTIVPVVATLATLIGTRYLYSLTAATTAMTLKGVATLRAAAFQTAMTASMTGTTRATVVATAATRTFSAAILANPLGVVLVAVTALAAGLYLLSSRYSSTAVAARELDRVTGAADTALEQYRQAVEKAKNASAEERKELEAKAAALRTVTLARINDARVAAQVQINEAVTARAKADTAIQRYGDTRERVGTNAGSNAGAALVGGARSQAQGAINYAGRAKAEADKAIQGLATLEGTLKEIDNPTTPKITAPAGDDKKGGKKASGPSAEDLARTRELLALQAQLELLRAQGREEDARGVQRQIDIINVTKQFEDAQIDNAKEAATAQVDALALAEAAARGREAAAERTKFFIDAATEGLKLQREQQDRSNDAAAEQLQFQAELARLSGDPKRMEQAEREVYIAQRVNDLLRDKVGLITEADTAAARNTATNEYNALDGAEREGALREEFRRSFKDGIQAALDGDMAGFFESLADRFTDRMLDNLADNLFDLVSQAAKGFGSGGGSGAGGWMSAIASVFGARATGGSVTAGQPYIVGERRPEVFVPHTNGTVIPSVNAAMGRMDQASAARAQQIAVRIDVNDDRFNAYVDGRAAPLAVQSTAAGVAYSQDQANNAGRRRRQSLV